MTAVGHQRIQALGESHVFLPNVDIDESAQLAVVIENPPADSRVGRVESLDDLPQRSGLGCHLGRAADVGPQDRRNPHAHAHEDPTEVPKADSNASTVGTMASGMATTGSTASSVLRPSPELMMTVSASGSSWPDASSLRSTPTVTPPAVSPKMPWVRASSRMESTTSSSETSAIAPPVRRTTSSTYGPSAGLPIASDLAIVSGRTGFTTSQPFANACETGEQPLACAPKTRHLDCPTRPSSANSENPLSIFTSCAPDATGTTICSGIRQPSCSAISKPRVLDPSA